MQGKKDGVDFEKLLDFHQCSKEELNQFPEASSDSKMLLDRYKLGERSLFCLDWDQIGQELTISGIETNENYQRWEFFLTSCNYIHAEYVPIGDTEHEDCVKERSRQAEYLGNMRLVMLVTDYRFSASQYDDYSIRKRSKIHTR